MSKRRTNVISQKDEAQETKSQRNKPLKRKGTRECFKKRLIQCHYFAMQLEVEKTDSKMWKGLNRHHR